MIFSTQAVETADTSAAVAAIAERIVINLGGQPNFVLAAYSEHHDPAAIHEGLSARFPKATLLGSSTCRGLITQNGLMGFGKPALGITGFCDPDGAYGTAGLIVEDDMQATIDQAVERAQTSVDRIGEIPDLTWLHASPGNEEAMISGLQTILGGQVLISGGSSADESISGKWSQFETHGVASGAAIALIYTGQPITHHFQSGYLPTNFGGEITRADGRILHEIDGRPAAIVYNEWTDGAISAALEDRSLNILGDSAWFPLGKSIGHLGPSPELMVDCYCLIHPDSVGPNDELRLFAEVAEGSRIVLMKSGREELIKRANQVVRTSLEMAPKDMPVSGALLVFCAGCMLALGDDIWRVADELKSAYGDVPFMGVFTFGEQGSFLNGERLHGNLMISSSLFSGAAETI